MSDDKPVISQVPPAPTLVKSPLWEQRLRFSVDIASLVLWGNQQVGYAVVYNELYRPPEMALIYAERGAGIAHSLHCNGLAGDLLVYISGIYRVDPEAYRPLGEKWKKLSPLNHWGGDWHTLDAGHFERRPE